VTARILLKQNLRKRLNEKFLKPLLEYLKQGISPEKLALCISLGGVIGLFPIIGVTTVICAAVAIIFKLNMAIIQLINYFVYPIQILLLIPMVKFGAMLFGTNPVPYTITELLDLFNEDFIGAIEILWVALLYGLLAWTIIAIPLGIMLYLISKAIFIRLARKPVSDQ